MPDVVVFAEGCQAFVEGSSGDWAVFFVVGRVNGSEPAAAGWEAFLFSVTLFREGSPANCGSDLFWTVVGEPELAGTGVILTWVCPGSAEAVLGSETGFAAPRSAMVAFVIGIDDPEGLRYQYPPNSSPAAMGNHHQNKRLFFRGCNFS